VYKWQRIKVLHSQGVSIRKIAKTVGVSRNTVKKYIKEAGPPKFKAREYPKQLDKFREEIETMLGKGYIGTRIHKELTKNGYTGSLASVHRFLRAIKAERKIAKLATTRVETGPGEQMQYDWKEWYLTVDGKKVKVYIHEVILCFSRLKYYTFSLTITCADVVRALCEAIIFFGGCAAQLVLDNAAQMVITHHKDGIIRYNEEFLKFCGLYGVEPSPCKTYRPRTKGKVERPFFYVQEHLLRGLEVNSLNEFEAKLTELRDEYNQRPHSELGRSPQEMFAQEREHLLKMPSFEPSLLLCKEPRRVSNDGYISYNGNLYPVPMRYCTKTVWVEVIYGRQMKVYDGTGELVTEFELCWHKQTGRPVHPEHEVLNRQYRQKRARARSVLVEKFTAAFGSAGRAYLEGLKNSAGANLYWHLSEIMRCLDVYTAAEVEKAITECLEIGSYHKNSVKRLLAQKEVTPLPLDKSPANCCPPEVKIVRDLSCYALTGSGADAL